jgi:O-antigen ligase
MTENPYYAGQPAAARPRGAGMAIAALVLGILALLLCWTIIGGVLLGLVAIVLGVVASTRARRGVAGGFGMAVAGIVLGLLGLLASALLVFVGVSFLNSPGARTLQECLQDAGDDRAKVEQCQRDFQRDLEN